MTKSKTSTTAKKRFKLVFGVVAKYTCSNVTEQLVIYGTVVKNTTVILENFPVYGRVYAFRHHCMGSLRWIPNARNNRLFLCVCVRLTKVNLVQHLFSVPCCSSSSPLRHMSQNHLHVLHQQTSSAAGFCVESACCSPDVKPDVCLSYNLDW